MNVCVVLASTAGSSCTFYMTYIHTSYIHEIMKELRNFIPIEFLSQTETGSRFFGRIRNILHSALCTVQCFLWHNTEQ